MAAYQKCTEQGYCKWLLERTQEYNPKSKGLMICNYINKDTHKRSGSLIAYHKGKGDEGLLLNFCPFCGFSFYDLHKAGKKVGCSG